MHWGRGEVCFARQISSEEIEKEAENYLAHLILQWRTPLTEVNEDRFGDQVIQIELGGSLQH